MGREFLAGTTAYRECGAVAASRPLSHTNLPSYEEDWALPPTFPRQLIHGRGSPAGTPAHPRWGAVAAPRPPLPNSAQQWPGSGLVRAQPFRDAQRGSGAARRGRGDATAPRVTTSWHRFPSPGRQLPEPHGISPILHDCCPIGIRPGPTGTAGRVGSCMACVPGRTTRSRRCAPWSRGRDRSMAGICPSAVEDSVSRANHPECEMKRLLRTGGGAGLHELAVQGDHDRFVRIGSDPEGPVVARSN